jgi:hypothetical protein
MHWSLEFMPAIPSGIFWAAAAAAILLAALLVWTRRRGNWMRIVSLALLVTALANPNLVREDRDPLPNIAVVEVDASTSQKLGNREARTADLLDALKTKLHAIPNLEVRIVTSGNSGSAAKEETTLFTDLNRGLADVPPDRLAGVIMITDGQVHDAPPSAASLGLNAPLHALITGSPGERDDRLDVVSAPRFGIVGTDQYAEIKVEHNGPRDEAAPHTAKLTVRRENEPVETLTAAYGEIVRVRFPFKHAGQTLMEVELEPRPDELTLVNNRTVLTADGVRENLRVLLVSGEPHAGERTWRNLLRSDASVNLVHFTILRPPEKQDGIPINQLSLIAFPTRELFAEKLHDFDLIIFDRYQRRGVLPLIYLDNVARYVEQGGAVLVAAGPDFASSLSLAKTPLGDVLPIKPTGRLVEEPFRPHVTAEGQKHPVTAGLAGEGINGGEPAWGRWMRLIDTTAYNGDVLMTGAGAAPLLVLSRQGEGRVAALLSDHAWLWARGFDGGGPHADLLRRLSHWLMKEPDLEEETLRASGEGNKLTIERRSMKEHAGDATLTSPSGKTSALGLDAAGPGLWRKTVDAAETGVYRITMGELSTIALVGNLNSREFAKVVAAEDALKPAASATGGGIFWMGDGVHKSEPLPRIVLESGVSSFHGSGWMGLKDREAHVVRGVRYTPLLEGFAALGLLLGVFSFTWHREGR